MHEQSSLRSGLWLPVGSKIGDIQHQGIGIIANTCYLNDTEGLSRSADITAYDAGNFKIAHFTQKRAKKWMLAGVITGSIAGIIWFIVFMAIRSSYTTSE